jgi:hypothetical protein
VTQDASKGMTNDELDWEAGEGEADGTVTAEPSHGCAQYILFMFKILFFDKNIIENNTLACEILTMSSFFMKLKLIY